MEKLPHNFFTYEPRPTLLEAILARIDTEKVRRAHRVFIALVSSALVSLSLCIWAIEYAVRQFVHSEFPHFVSLIFTDSTAVLTMWHEFLYALTESFPFFAVLLACLTLGTVLGLMRQIAKNFSATAHQITI